MSTAKEKIAADLKKSSESIRKFCLDFPESVEDHPWGESAFKVKKKTFLFMSLDSDGMRLSFKLQDSLFNTLALPFCEPTGYGLGKSGWVTATFEPGDKISVERIQSWINESFKLVAPKTVLKQLDGSAPKTSGAKPSKNGKNAKSAQGKTDASVLDVADVEITRKKKR